jgi:signal transduction histidine kinase
MTLFRSTAFRLVALYLAMFALSVGAILGYVYWNTALLLERQTDDTLRAEVQGLSDQYQLRGLRGLADTIQRRGQDSKGSLYLLANPAGGHIIGNLNSLPDEAEKHLGFFEFPYNFNNGRIVEIHQARAFHSELEGGFELVVGRDVEELRQFGQIIRNSMLWALGIALVLGVSGGLLLSRNFLRRVDSITAASQSIMAGDLSGRMPVAGTGDELDKLAQSLNEMLDQIERLMAGMREVSSNVAHDLRSPLTRLKARVESALRSGKPNEHKAALEQTIEEADRLIHTFNALLSIARAEAGQSREGLQDMDAKPVIEEVAELYEPIAEEAGGSFTIEIADGLRVHADRQLLSQAVANLLDNALKYGVAGEAPPEIVVTGVVEGEDIVIAVSDRGPGIPEADRERVKDRFVRLDQSRTKPGNGLGLSLATGVMKLHGGRLVLEDNGPGLRAKLILPRIAA